MTVATIPRRFNTDTMRSFLRLVIDNDQPVSNEIDFDFSTLDFIEPPGVVILSNIIEWLRNRGVSGKILNCDIERSAVHYLDDVGFFRYYCGNSLSTLAHIRNTTYPFSILQCDQSFQEIDGHLFPWMASALGVPETTLSEIKTSIRELFNNIADHSTEHIGCMHVQIYPNRHQISFAISDFGIGIPREVRTVVPSANDYEALAWATKEGNSSKSGGHNMGAGLSYLIDNVVHNNRGSIEIHSGYAFIKFNPSAENGVGNMTQSLYPGTLVSIILQSDNLNSEVDEANESPW